MNVLVTGAAGFIGSHLVQRLLDRGHQVIAIDKEINPVKLERVRRRKDFYYFVQDITKTEWELDFGAIDWVFHTAANVITRESMLNPLQYNRTNVFGTANVFEFCRINKVKKVINFASASCYGQATIIPTPETAEIKPVHPYAATKYLAEQTLLHFGKIYSIPVISLRMYYVYGPRTRKDCVFDKFLQLKREGKPYTITGDGNQKNDFLYISDVIDAAMLAANSNFSSEVFNLGSGEVYTMNDLCNALGGTIVYLPKLDYDPEFILGDITKAEKLLDWRPKVSFEEGVRLTLKAEGF